MFVKNAWYIAAMSDEVGRSLLQRWILDEPVVMYRTEDGGPVALRDVCPTAQCRCRWASSWATSFAAVTTAWSSPPMGAVRTFRRRRTFPSAGV